MPSSERPEEAHPTERQLESFMRGELPRPEVHAIVRHLLTGCPRCVEITRRLWKLGNPLLRDLAAPPRETRVPAEPEAT